MSCQNSYISIRKIGNGTWEEVEVKENTALNRLSLLFSVSLLRLICFASINQFRFNEKPLMRADECQQCRTHHQNLTQFRPPEVK